MLVSLQIAIKMLVSRDMMWILTDAMLKYLVTKLIEKHHLGPTVDALRQRIVERLLTHVLRNCVYDNPSNKCLGVFRDYNLFNYPVASADCINYRDFVFCLLVEMGSPERTDAICAGT